MGTNYYVKEEKCKCCGHSPKQLHIGMKACGWSFSFHATDEIVTWKDWCEYLKNHTIVNEYGKELSLENFKAMVIKHKDEKNHTLYCRKSFPIQAEENLHLDPEGYSFSTGEFF